VPSLLARRAQTSTRIIEALMMDRRTLLLAFLSGAVTAPTAARAQRARKVYRIGLLGGSSPTAHEASARLWDAFFQGLRELGYVEGQTIVVEGRWYGENTERLPSLAVELVQAKVDVIVAGAPPAPEAAARATSTIPIVMAGHPDPVGSGLAVSLAEPGRNVTGLSDQSPDLVAKRLQLLKEVVPEISQVAVLWNPTNPTLMPMLTEVELAARSVGVKLQILEARVPDDFTSAFSAMTRDGAGGLIVLGSSIFFAERSRIAALAAHSRLPVISGPREFAEAGFLMSYGSIFAEQWRRAAAYVDKILQGANPADLPIEQPTKFELRLNMKAAKTLGLTIPPSLLARADAVIE
jgi:putative ABC transport system substrate-binding protein